MKINKLWAMFDEKGTLWCLTIRRTRRGVIAGVEIKYKTSWKWYYRHGYRIKKVVVLPVDKAGQFLPRSREQ